MTRRRALAIVCAVAAIAAAASTSVALSQYVPPRKVHLVGLKNQGQAAIVRQLYGTRALWAWDPARQRYLSLANYSPRRGAALFTSNLDGQVVRDRLALLAVAVQQAGRAAAALVRPVASLPATAPPAAVSTTTSASPVTSAPAPTAPTAPPPASGAPAPDGGSAGPWHLVFDDEFNGSSLDSSRWTPYWFSEGSTSNQTTMVSSNVAVSGGALQLSLRGPTGGLVSSNGKFSFIYGYVEARIDLPGTGSIGNWPAFWTDGQNWPVDGEMDVMEGLGGAACWHFHDSSGGPGGCAAGSFTGWHTYGADWEPGRVSYYYDGQLVGQISSGITAEPMYLILENSGGAWGGSRLDPATLQVDYVRVWQH